MPFSKEILDKPNASIPELKAAIEERDATIRALTTEKQEALEKRDEYERKVNQQPNVLTQLRDEQTQRAVAEARMAMMSVCHAEAVRQLTASQNMTAQLRRDIAEEREKWAEEREAWHAERAHLNATMISNGKLLVEHYKAHCDKAGREFVRALKRPRTGGDAP